MAESAPIPFYNAAGEHLITLDIELGEDGQPPAAAAITGTDETTGTQIRRVYELQSWPGHAPPWRYVEADHVSIGVPEPGSPEAVARVRRSVPWRLPGQE